VPTTLTRSVARGQESVPRLRLDPRSRHRRPALAVGSIALVVACVAVFVSLYMRAGHEVSVLAISRPVAQGQIVSANDLTIVRISTTSSIETLPATDGAVVVGRRAAEPLEPNTLLTSSELSTGVSPPGGEAIVGIAAKEGQLPASGVAPGESVDVILTGLPGSADATTGVNDQASGAYDSASDVPGTVLESGAQVLDVVPSPSSSGSNDVVVSLLVSRTTAPLVATAAAADQIALVVVAPRS